MQPALLFRTLILLAVLACTAALARPTPSGFIALCSPPTNDVCVDKQCQCSRITCSHCGVKSFTCDEATGQSTCVCKTC